MDIEKMIEEINKGNLPSIDKPLTSPTEDSFGLAKQAFGLKIINEGLETHLDANDKKDGNL